jgi:hypothetical protein
MKTYVCLIVLFFVASSAGQTYQQEKASSRASMHRAMIQGIWWSSDLPQCAAFQVNDSTFYYPDEFVYRKYEIKGDSLFVFLDDGDIISSAVVKLTTDTLILFSFGKEHLYTRAEPRR